MTVKIYRKTALMRAVQFDGTPDNLEEIVDFLRRNRGEILGIDGRAMGYRDAGIIPRTGDWFYVTSGVTREQYDAHIVLFEDPEVLAVLWNDLHKYWNPLRLTDHVALDSQGCFYPISDTDVIGSYTEVGEK